MSEQSQAPAEQTDNTSGKSEKPNETVAYETYRKTVNAEKNLRAKAQELEAELNRLRQEKDLAEGNKDKVIEELRKKSESFESELKKTKANYAWASVSNEFKRAATKHGCKDPDKLLRLLDDEDLGSIEVGENFSVNQDALEKVIAKGKKENYFLFSTTEKVAAPGTPGVKAPEEKKSLKDLSLAELKAKYKELHK